MQHNDRRRLTDPPYGPSTPPAHPSDAGFRQAILGLVPEELASRIAETFPRLGDFAALRAAIASHLRGAIEEERRGLHTTLRLCVQTFDQVLAGPGVPGDLRAAVRACRGLCLAGLAEGAEPPDEEEGQGAEGQAPSPRFPRC